MGIKEDRKRAAEAMLQKVKLAMAEAHAAAEQAVEEFLKAAPRRPDGYVHDAAGFAYVMVHKPSYHLRAALKQAHAIPQLHGTPLGWDGMWCVSNFSRHAKGPAWQSIAAQEKACRAACDVLDKRLGEYGYFRVTSRLD